MNLRIAIILSCFFFFCLQGAEAKKVKTSLSIVKETGTSRDKSHPEFEGKEIVMTDSVSPGEDKDIREQLLHCIFTGYEKEINSNKESFILKNEGNFEVSGFKVKIVYYDMQGRMLHSQTVTLPCEVPPGEARKFDIRSWDSQHTYFYYLGNEPKKVATPFKVEFKPLSIWIKDGE